MSQKAVRARAGFTLIELIIVMVVVSIVATIGMPRIDLARMRMDSGFRQVGITMLAAQRTAMLKQHAVIVALDTVLKRVRIHQDQNNDGVMQSTEPVTYLALEGGVIFGRGTAPAMAMGSGPITFAKRQSGLPAITFHRSGSAGEAGGFYLTSARGVNLARYASDARAFQVNRATGRVAQFQYAGGVWRRRF
jgi:prepilin-type N-terminal cleavage/methylation domain-containing protein